MKSGEELERIVALIEELYNELLETEIHRNYKIKDRSGNDSEIDVLVITKVNDYVIKIAIECKDWNKKIPVEKIDAFNSKCSRIDGINKKVFVSSHGFQKGAIDSAGLYGIDLYTARIIDKEIVSNWFPVKQLKLIKHLPYTDIKLIINNITEDDIKSIGKIDPNENLYYLDGSKTTVPKVLNNSFEENKGKFWNLAIVHWMQNEEKKWDKIEAPFQLSMEPPLQLETNSRKFLVSAIEAKIQLQLTEKGADIMGVREVHDQQGHLKARSIKVNFGDGKTGDIILDRNKKTSFYVKDDSGNDLRLKSLFKYDPNTDTFSKGPDE